MTNTEQNFVNKVKKVCRDNYDAGGDAIIECYSDQEIIDQFKSMSEVKEFIGLRVENATNHRWGEDTNPELATLRRFEEAEWTED